MEYAGPVLSMEYVVYMEYREHGVWSMQALYGVCSMEYREHGVWSMQALYVVFVSSI